LTAVLGSARWAVGLDGRIVTRRADQRRPGRGGRLLAVADRIDGGGWRDSSGSNPKD
jgi:hypothetical protein